MFRNFFAAVSSVFLASASLFTPSPAAAQTNVTGQWTRLADLPFAPVHESLLANGKIAIWGRSSSQTLFDPITQSISTMPNPGFDLFCSGHAFLPDGRLFSAGGHVSDFVGVPYAAVYNPATNSWAKAPDMNDGRWYPTVTPLPNGDLLVISGQTASGIGVDTLPQVYQPATNSWRDLSNAQLDQPLYPMMFVAPNGKLVDIAPSSTSRWLDTSGTGAWSLLGERTFPWRDYASAVMYADGKIMLTGGSDPPTASTEVIDLNVANPAWRSTAPMSIARRHVNATALPDGTVLATGGTYGSGHNNETTPVFTAELWNPATETWTVLASATFPRLYHSSALLLPDGRVLTLGGDNRPELEAFSPPYLFKGARPTMSGVPSAVAYGQHFTVQSPDAANISKVTMLRLASVTHAFNMNQRINTLPFTRGSGTLDITPPANANLAPPGQYMLFLVNSSGVPSMAGFVQLGNTASPPPPPPQPGPAPTVASLSPTGATAGGAAFTLTVNGSNFVSGAVVRWNGAARTTTFASGTQVRAAITSADIASAGDNQVSVANPDGGTSGNFTFTVAAAPPPPPPVNTFGLSVTKTGNSASKGTVTSTPAGISCGATCNAQFDTGTSVTLRVTTTGNGAFAGWGGACSGTATTCTVPMNSNMAVTATINRR